LSHYALAAAVLSLIECCGLLFCGSYREQETRELLARRQLKLRCDELREEVALQHRYVPLRLTACYTNSLAMREMAPNLCSSCASERMHAVVEIGMHQRSLDE
jgi:hypothetical protein